MEPEPLPGGYGAALMQTLLALGAVCILAWALLRWFAQRGLVPGRWANLGFGGRGKLRVVERLSLDARHGLFLVRAGRRIFLVGSGEHSVSLVAELSEHDLETGADEFSRLVTASAAEPVGMVVDEPGFAIPAPEPQTADPSGGPDRDAQVDRIL